MTDRSHRKREVKTNKQNELEKRAKYNRDNYPNIVLLFECIEIYKLHARTNTYDLEVCIKHTKYRQEKDNNNFITHLTEIFLSIIVFPSL